MERWRKTIFPELSSATDGELNGYLLGAIHDACFSRAHGTMRFAQKDRRWLEVLGYSLDRLGFRSWTYREGRRDVHILETSWMPDDLVLLDEGEAAAYVRGYFDTEGGMPRSPDARFYIQLVQKDRDDLEELRLICSKLGIACGRIHNPSVKVDPDYWRFYVLSGSHRDFCESISSWHPGKRNLLEERMAHWGRADELEGGIR